MARGSKRSYTGKQKRKASKIEKGYRKRDARKTKSGGRKRKTASRRRR